MPFLFLFLIIFVFEANAEESLQTPLLACKKENICNLSLPNQFFSGRGKELKAMENTFSKLKDVTLTIVGISGIGKTQLAKQYAVSSRKNYELIWWFNAENVGRQGY